MPDITGHISFPRLCQRPIPVFPMPFGGVNDSMSEVRDTEMVSPHLARCEELWYLDGSIVLAAEGVAFKVYRMLLAQHSSVFADMLAISHPDANVDPLYDCPLVHMPDSAEDLRCLLLAIHDINSGERLDNAPFAEAAAVASLAAKYDIPRLRDRALQRFDSWFPGSLHKWNVRPTLAPTDYVKALRIARQLQRSCTLPLIMLALCDRGLDAILSAGLEPNDLRIALHGFVTLQGLQRTHPFRWIYRVSAACASVRECGEQKARLSRTIEEAFIKIDKLCLFEHGFSRAALEHVGLCLGCIDDAMITDKTGRQRAWEEVPAAFNGLT
ncbi:hypothetical protein PUNSTDRAFT_146513 [Punctularia strigosozonata HHB-11173 SS5]|uniref:BTB domain-containing protein n=1 Tax=Punctularia strigosozonata (strain HHB-11173) TaxID=741275 RepID=R7S346_PUNST|nr:uncharacterized protein PUNSTDRAFT_146513 [Punctularia strigosozonata HHB-11173 SS5]EIN04254.1 hypothetical protein PUNSTDRAFT_146513 [Punctularia strigosozonata HHB-11173 SS5]